MGSRTEAPGPLLLITKTHQPSGGVETPTEITPYPGSCVFFQPFVTLRQQTLSTDPAKRKLAFPRGNFTFGKRSWTSWNTCSHNFHSPKVIKMDRGGGWHHSDQLLETDFDLQQQAGRWKFRAMTGRIEEEQRRQTVFLRCGTG